MGQFGSGLSSSGSLGALAVSSEGVADQQPHRRAPHPDVRAVGRHHACVHAVVCGKKLADKGITAMQAC